MISAVSVAISRSASIGAPGGSSPQREAVSAAASTMVGANNSRREAWMIGATMRLRCFHRSPSLMNSPSPSSGDSAWRICGVLRWKLSCIAMKACATVSGLLQMNTRRFSTRVEKNWYSKHFSSNIAIKLRRIVAIIAKSGSGSAGRSG